MSANPSQPDAAKGRKPQGRHPHKRLTAAFIGSAPQGRHFDGEGLFLLVEKHGARRWGQRLTIYGRRRELGLGSPPVVSLAAARELALENKRMVRDGKDPTLERRKAEVLSNRSARTPTFKEAIEGCFQKVGPELSTEKYRKQWRSSLDLYAVPILGGLPVDEIDPDDVLTVLKPIWLDKTETAKRLRGRIEAVLRWAKSEGFIDGPNPARWVDNLDGRLPRPSRIAKVQHQPSLSIKDAPEWFAKLKTRTGNAARALEFAVLTAARSGEVRGMTWSEVDPESGLWIIPASRMKAGKEHRVPLSKPALELLSVLPRRAGSVIVFFAPEAEVLSDMAVSGVMRRMHAAEVSAGRSGFVDTSSGRPAVPHGLRSTFRDWVAEKTAFPGEMAEVALAHKVANVVEAAYRRGDQVEKRRQMMAAWAGFLSGESGKVVRLEVRHG